MQLFAGFTGFDWDVANREKSWRRHKVTWLECEEAFFNQPLYVSPDPRHSLTEERFYALGSTHNERLLFVVFTRRKSRIRIISARDMSKRERKAYIEKTQRDSKV
jgi:uncharacterized DUF497 family protein